MTSTIMNTTDIEVVADHCLEIGEVILPGDTHYECLLAGKKESELNDDFNRLEQRARDISKTCKVNKVVSQDDGRVTINAMFDFDCTVEKMIFELYLRP
ncbi:DUF406 family protein [Parendozoicomonas haliclonae]|uniref:Uncharacterized protein n=1 Tax=Parendozoicomonas haliclonae TaxID=1960125 RepID=A0A1X7ARC2_9GAMM|nr:DUF406 family protein [Parendozoicomonas haliclonae]SMA50785.1 hypothetical protein EHSB41UT_04602 [Parendozoicomonas haliclonae]